MNCDYVFTAARRCHRPATHQLVQDADGLAEIVLYDPIVKLARYCLDHAERLALSLNGGERRRATEAHRNQLPHRAGACCYCTPGGVKLLRLKEPVHT